MSSHLWFWSFWHWNSESFRAGALLRSPLEGIGGHWDEWYRHEATDEERAAIAECGASVGGQRAFVRWLARHWSREAASLGARPPVRFVVGQLAHLAPFDTWDGMRRYRHAYGRAGVSAVVLGEGSAGEAGDVRRLEALLVPTRASSAPVQCEGFEADAAQLRAALDATRSALRGRGMRRLLLLWILAGRRPYARWVARTIGAGWLLTAALTLWMRVGPDPGMRLVPRMGAIVALWSLLAIVGVTTVLVTVVAAVRDGNVLERQLARSQVRLRMEGALTLIGGSAGLAFALNILTAMSRVREAPRRAWLWRRLLIALRQAGERWAATGVLHADGRVGAVVLAPKTRACMLHPRVRNLLTPPQRRSASGDTRAQEPSLVAPSAPNVSDSFTAGARLGFAAEPNALRSHRCHHLVDALLAVGGLTSRWVLVSHVLAIATSGVLLASLPALMDMLLPPPAPVVGGPAAMSAYQLQLSLDTARPAAFAVVLESAFWANRRARVVRSTGPGAAAIADLRLERLAHQVTRDAEDGVVYVERRYRFLGREFAQGERVGRYALASLVQQQE